MSPESETVQAGPHWGAGLHYYAAEISPWPPAAAPSEPAGRPESV
jgi:hypothetical protein